ncbi:MAG: hypothetical protein ACI8XO_002227 [Verrucomicrobiales bacterium]
MVGLKFPTVKIALALVLLSGVLWFSMLAVPFVPLPLTGGQKGALAFALFIAAEISFWAGALLVGKQVIYRYLGKLWPWKKSPPADPLAPFAESGEEDRDQQGPEPALRPGDENHRSVDDHEGEEQTQ